MQRVPGVLRARGVVARRPRRLHRAAQPVPRRAPQRVARRASAAARLGASAATLESRDPRARTPRCSSSSTGSCAAARARARAACGSWATRRSTSATTAPTCGRARAVPARRRRRAPRANGPAARPMDRRGQIWPMPAYDWGRPPPRLRLVAAPAAPRVRHRGPRTRPLPRVRRWWGVRAAASRSRGAWYRGPGGILRRACARELGELELVVGGPRAPRPSALRDLRPRRGLPQMRVLVRGLDEGGESADLPHGVDRNEAAYTDERTTSTRCAAGRAAREPREDPLDPASVRAAFDGGAPGRAAPGAIDAVALTRAVRDRADAGLDRAGSEGRMNVPGSAGTAVDAPTTRSSDASREPSSRPRACRAQPAGSILPWLTIRNPGWIAVGAGVARASLGRRLARMGRRGDARAPHRQDAAQALVDAHRSNRGAILGREHRPARSRPAATARHDARGALRVDAGGLRSTAPEDAAPTARTTCCSRSASTLRAAR